MNYNYREYIVGGVCNDLRVKAKDDKYDPPLAERDRYCYWVTTFDEKTCLKCYKHHEKIFSRYDNPEKYAHKHLFCRCQRVAVKDVKSETATKDGENGADWWLKYRGCLPPYYISAEEMEKLGWDTSRRPSAFAPGKTLIRCIYDNDNGKLPDASGRIWMEADINYTTGWRNKHRIL